MRGAASQIKHAPHVAVSYHEVSTGHERREETQAALIQIGIGRPALFHFPPVRLSCEAAVAELQLFYYCCCCGAN